MLELICSPVDDIRSPRWYWILKEVKGEGAIAQGEANNLDDARRVGKQAAERHHWAMHEADARFVLRNGEWTAGPVSVISSKDEPR